MTGSKSLGGTPMKMLIEHEMAKDKESRRKAPSLITRLMGLDDELPTQHPSNAASQRRSANADLRSTSSAPSSGSRSVEYKDIYEVGHQLPEFSDQRRADLVHQKFIEAKRLASNDNLLQSREFQDAIEVLNSNRDLFLKFLEEPNSIFSQQATECCSVPLGHAKQITILKPYKTVSTYGDSMVRRQHTVERSSCLEKTPHSHTPRERRAGGKGTRVVVLKPLEQLGASERYASSQEATFTPKDGSAYSADESSSNHTDNEEEEYNLYSNSEAEYPSSGNSSDNACRYGSTYTVSPLSAASSSPESMLMKEAKKQLSQHRALDESNEMHREQKPVLRSFGTLSQMLALPDSRREEINDNTSMYSGRNLNSTEGIMRARSNVLFEEVVDDSLITQCLPRSKSVSAVSSIYANIHLQTTCSEIQEKETSSPTRIVQSPLPKQVEKPVKDAKSFRGKFSSLFARQRKAIKELLVTAPLVGTAEGVQSTIEKRLLTFGSSEAAGVTVAEGMEMESSAKKLQKKFPPLSTVKQELCSSSTEVVVSLQEMLTNEVRNRNSDQPSPSSVLEIPFEDDNEDISKSSEAVRHCTLPDALSRSLSIKSVARKLVLDKQLPGATSDLIISSPTDKCSHLKQYRFIKMLLASSGLGREMSNVMFFGWHSPDQPVDIACLERFIDLKAEEAKCREKRCTQRLLFDFVNSTLVEIGHDALANVYPCHDSCAPIAKACLSNEPLLDVVWRLVRNRFFTASEMLNLENCNVVLAVDRVMMESIQGRRGWEESLRSELIECWNDLCGEVLNELVGELLSDFVYKSLE